jgi:hypothetical protein
LAAGAGTADLAAALVVFVGAAFFFGGSSTADLATALVVFVGAAFFFGGSSSSSPSSSTSSFPFLAAGFRLVPLPAGLLSSTSSSSSFLPGHFPFPLVHPPWNDDILSLIFLSILYHKQLGLGIRIMVFPTLKTRVPNPTITSIQGIVHLGQNHFIKFITSPFLTD